MNTHFQIETPKGMVLFAAYCSQMRFIQDNHKLIKIRSLKEVDGALPDSYNPLNYKVEPVDPKSIIAYNPNKPVYIYKVLLNGKKVSTKEYTQPKTDYEVIINHIYFLDDLPF